MVRLYVQSSPAVEGTYVAKPCCISGLWALGPDPGSDFLFTADKSVGTECSEIFHASLAKCHKFQWTLFLVSMTMCLCSKAICSALQARWLGSCEGQLLGSLLGEGGDADCSDKGLDSCLVSLKSSAAFWVSLLTQKNSLNFLFSCGAGSSLMPVAHLALIAEYFHSLWLSGTRFACQAVLRWIKLLKGFPWISLLCYFDSTTEDFI